MFRTENLPDLIEQTLLKQVILSKQEQLPLLGDKMHDVMSALYERLLNESKDPLLNRMMIPSLTEFYARIGAYAATVNTIGKLYEVGCGLAIPSLAYSLLTNRPVIAVDTNRKEIKNTHSLTEKLEVKTLNLKVENAVYRIKGKGPWYSLRDYASQKPTSDDTLLVVNPVDDALDAALIESNVHHVIFVGGPGKLFGRHEIYTSAISGKELWTQWFQMQNIQPYLESKGWKNFILSGEDASLLMPNMALLHLSR